MSQTTAPPQTSDSKDWTIREVMAWTAKRFAAREIASARLDAELLIAFCLGLPRIQLYAQSDRLLTPEELAAIRACITRRQNGESVAYVTGKKEFWGLEFSVDARVLVPRPDTETLVECALDLVKPKQLPTHEEAADTNAGETPIATVAPAAPSLRILDIGTGSGALAITLGKNLPNAKICAVDVSPDALIVAKANAEFHQVVIAFHQGHLLVPVEQHPPFDLIVSNLPYIPSEDIKTLSVEVRHEPLLALDGGKDGLDLVRTLVSQALVHLSPGGWLALEIGDGQAETTAKLMRAAGFSAVFTKADLGGIQRVVAGQRCA